jgi:hypothetical protein
MLNFYDFQVLPPPSHNLLEIGQEVCYRILKIHFPETAQIGNHRFH